MAHPIDGAMADPWGALRLVLGEPLHPGGDEATAALLDRAGVTDGTRVLDVGCGAGGALALARDRGARAVGLDRQPVGSDGRPVGSDGQPAGDGTVRGDLAALPVGGSSVDVVLAECVLCLAPDLSRVASEVRRVLRTDGRLAVSDVVIDGEPPDVPAPFDELLCLDDGPGRRDLAGALSRAGFAVEAPVDHRDDLLAMRDRAAARVDYERLLPAFGDRGRALLDGIRRLEAAIEAGRVGYVSVVARPDG